MSIGKIGVAECNNCIGLDKCNKYCAKQAGRALADYIIGLETVETDIGSVRKPSKRGDKSLIVLGHQAEGNSDVYIMRELDSTVSIQSSEKFKKFYGKKTTDVLKAFTDTLDSELYNDRINIVKSMIKGINSNKIMIVPFKFESDVIVRHEKYSKEDIHGKIKCLLWKVDKETCKIKGQILIVQKGPIVGNARLIVVDFDEYGEKLELQVVKESLQTSEIQPEIIKLTQEGMARPIVIKTKTTVLGIDSKYLYDLSNETTEIIGNWTDKGLIEFGVTPNLKRTKAYKKIKSALKYIDMHKRLIAPLGIVEENIIEA